MKPTGIDPEMVAVFLEEASDSLEAILRLRDDWDRLGDDDLRRGILDVFRSFHNLKGAARIVGLRSAEEVAHAAEEVLRQYVSAAGRPPRELAEALGNAGLGIVAHAEGRAGQEALAELTRALVGFAGGPPAAALPEASDSAVTREAVEEPEASAAAWERVDPAAADAFIESAAPRAGEFVRVRTQYLDRLATDVAELLTQQAQFENSMARLEETLHEVQAANLSSAGIAVGAMSALLTLQSECQSGARRLSQLGLDLGDSVRRARLIPLAQHVVAYRRVVEDVARELGKTVRFEADVGDLALDRRVLDLLRDPLMHLLRNAVDHGLEMSVERVQAGKDPVGRVQVRAQSRGAYIELSITDDGRGVPNGRVLTRAIERGLVTEAAAREMTASDVAELVFHPGLSTADHVSRISGRGMGLDVVRTRLRELGGNAALTRSTPAGTEFVLSVPADAVQTSVLLAAVADSVVALPVTHVERALRVPASALDIADGLTVARFDDAEPLPLHWLASLLTVTRERDADPLLVVVVRDGGRRRGIVVQQIVGEAVVVLRPLPWNLTAVAGVTSVAVLGDGRVALALDMAALLAGSSRADSSGSHGRAAARASEGTRTVLVVDDSATSRLLLRNILATAGYRVLVADDGDEAWAMLQRERVDLVVSDVQMPGLDGLALTRRIRTMPSTATLPVILVTALGRPEEVALGAEAGADEYIIKGRFDNRMLLEAVERHT